MKATQTCRDVILEFLADYVDGTLDLESARALEEHLRACGACMTYLDTYRKASELVGRHAAKGAMPDEMKDILRRFMLERMMRKAP